MHRALFWLLLPAIAIASRYVIIQTTGIYSLFHAVVSPGYGARRGTCKSYWVFTEGNCRHIVTVRLCASQSALKKLNCCKSRGTRAPVPHSWRRQWFHATGLMFVDGATENASHGKCEKRRICEAESTETQRCWNSAVFISL